MDLLQNPFHILAATSRDNRRRIIELADERSLLLDSNKCTEARSDLTTPRKRLSAEVAWLPGIGPKRTGEVLSLLDSSPSDLLGIDNLSSITRANVLAAGLVRLSDYNANDVATWIIEISRAFEKIDPDELTVIINEERVASGFSEVSDLSSVEAEIQERRRYYRQAIKLALDNLSSTELVEAVTIAVESATNGGEEHGPILIADLVDSYEVEAQGILDKEEENIRALVEKLRTAVDAERPDSTLAPVVTKLIQVVKNWDSIAQPIQVSTKSRGLDHDASLRVAGLVRGLAVHMNNEHGKLDFSQQLTNMLQEVFAEVGKVAERTAEDAAALEDLVKQRASWIENAKSSAEEWRKEITYEADVGAIFKDKLRISPEGIEWKRRRWDIDSITRIRWGGTRHSVNGIPTGTTYSIFWGNDSQYTSVELRREVVYSNFIDRLWKAVGIRLLAEYLEGLRSGQKYSFGSAIIYDHGIDLERVKFLGNERIFCRWDELVIWNEPGSFCIGKRDDKKFSVSLYYQTEDNIHVLEAAIRTFWKRAGTKLSSLLES